MEVHHNRKLQTNLWIDLIESIINYLFASAALKIERQFCELHG